MRRWSGLSGGFLSTPLGTPKVQLELVFEFPELSTARLLEVATPTVTNASLALSEETTLVSTMALGHSQLCVVYEMLKNNSRFADLRGNNFDTRNEDQVKAKMVSRLEAVGYKVILETKAA